jgi:dihydrofolate synthase/folylpolyglutamate synthase
VNAELLQAGRDFTWQRQGPGWGWRGNWRDSARARAGLPYPAMRGDYQLFNAAGVLMALETLRERFPVSQAHIRTGLLNAVLPGRFQTLPGQPVRVLDVAHNAEAASELAATLRAQTVVGRTLAVAGMLKDKPLVDVMRVMSPVVDEWHVAGLPTPRSASGEQLLAALTAAGSRQPATAHPDIATAYAAACGRAEDTDRIVVFGSFYTVGAILRLLT